MIAFNRNFVFLDEPALSCCVDETVESISVYEYKGKKLSSLFILQSTWVSMTERKVCYYANKAFEQNEKIDFWALEIENILTLIWNKDTQTIHYIKYINYSPKLLQFWILHTFFPLVLELEKNAHILHVSAVEINHKIILFSAFSGGGKSTLLNYFINQGHTIYGDDTIALKKDGSKYNVISSYPFHRPYRKAEDLGYKLENFGTKIKKLSKVYSLHKVDREEDVSIRTLCGIEKFKALYQSDFVMFETMQKERYLFATEIAKHVEVYQISVPWALERLDEVYQAIVTHNNV